MGIKDLFRKTKSTASDAAEAVVDTAGDVAEKAKDVAGDAVDKTREAVGNAAEAVVDKVDDLTGGRVPEAIKEAVDRTDDEADHGGADEEE